MFIQQRLQNVIHSEASRDLERESAGFEGGREQVSRVSPWLSHCPARGGGHALHGAALCAGPPQACVCDRTTSEQCCTERLHPVSNVTVHDA